MRRGFGLAFLLLSWAITPGSWAGTGLSPAEIDSLTVPRPGLVLIDPAVRAKQLRGADPVLVQRFCPSVLQAVPPVDLTPIPRLQGGMVTTSVGDRSAFPFTGFVMSGAAAALAGDLASGAAAVDALARWAAANAVSELTDGGPDKINTNALFSSRRMLLGLLPSWAILRQISSPPKATVMVIDGWLAQRVADSDVASGAITTRSQETALSNRNYHRLMREAVAMAHGALIGDAMTVAELQGRADAAAWVGSGRQAANAGDPPADSSPALTPSR